jgi:hypothetical protein
MPCRLPSCCSERLLTKSAGPCSGVKSVCQGSGSRCLLGCLCACETVSRGACPPVHSAGVFHRKDLWLVWVLLPAESFDRHGFGCT